MFIVNLTRSRFNEWQASRCTSGFSGWLNWAGRTHSQLQWHYSMGCIPRENKIEKPVFVYFCSLKQMQWDLVPPAPATIFFSAMMNDTQLNLRAKTNYPFSCFLSNDKSWYDDPDDYPFCESLNFHSFFNIIIMAPHMAPVVIYLEEAHFIIKGRRY